MSERLASLLAEQFHSLAAAVVRSGHRDLAAAVEAEIDLCGGPWPPGSGPSKDPHDRALIHAVRAWGRGDECGELTERACAEYERWRGVPATVAPVTAPTPLERTKAERSRRVKQMSLDLDHDDDGDDE
jgi:hypothetical protein